MHAVSCIRPIDAGHGGLAGEHNFAGPTIFGFTAQQETPCSAQRCAASNRLSLDSRRHSLLSDLMASIAQQAAEAEAEDAAMGEAGDDDAYDDDDEDEEDDLGEDDELKTMMEEMENAWSPSSSIGAASSIYSSGTSRASTCSSSRPIAIPAST